MMRGRCRARSASRLARSGGQRCPRWKGPRSRSGTARSCRARSRCGCSPPCGWSRCGSPGSRSPDERMGPMKRVGRGVLALAVAGLVVLGGIAAERAGPDVPSAAVRGTAVSSVWLCPHGGGEGWTGTIALADPGPEPVDVRITELSTGPPSAPVTITVPAGHEVLRPVEAGSIADATYIEVFGGWVAAGWLVRSAPPSQGLGVEPCAPAASRTWYTTDSDTQQGHRSYLVVMNPFSVEAVFDVALFRPRLPPVRSADWIDLTLPPASSIALNVGAKLLGQEIVGAEIDVR